ncbi:MAG: hydrogenase maturation nickel metallochaperone HypA [Proteobacteria bacterium]|nr:hydrogenase maturation nickel metallochaperone HypA [Pseudomonadota bacterium]
MHELSVCLSLLDQVQALSGERGAVRAARIELDVGPLSGIEIDLLESAWPLAAAGTIAADAELVITAMDIVIRCDACGAETAAEANRLVCGRCGDFRTTLVSGGEMILRRIELEMPDDR